MSEQGTGSGTPPAGTPPAGTPPAGTPPAGETPAWYSGFKDQTVKDWLQSYGAAYPDPESVAMKALNLEKFVGADKAGRGIIMPREGATPEEMRDFFAKVAKVPEKADGYVLPEAFAKDETIMKFREAAHKVGMPPHMFAATLEFYQGVATQQQQQFMAEIDRKGEADINSLRSEWPGVEFDKNIELGRRAAQQFIPHSNPQELEDTITRLEGAIGTGTVLKLLANIGKSIGEGEFISGEGDGGNNSGMTAGGARVRIDILKKDQAFQKRFLNGDADAKAEWDRLHKIAYAPQM